MPTLPCESIFQVIASGLDVENCRNIVYGSTVLKIHYVIGASLSEPHIDEFAVNFPYIYWGEPERAPHRRVCCKFSIYIYIYVSYVVP